MQNHFWLTSKLSEGDKCGLEHILVHLGSEVADEEVGAHIQRLLVHIRFVHLDFLSV